MSDLYPTKTRMALLEHIGDGSVRKDPYNTQIVYEMREPPRHNLTARTAEVIRAGWARVENYDVVLTEAGKAVLKGQQR